MDASNKPIRVIYVCNVLLICFANCPACFRSFLSSSGKQEVIYFIFLVSQKKKQKTKNSFGLKTQKILKTKT